MNVYFSLILFHHLRICGRFYIHSIITHIVAYSDLHTDQDCQKWELYFRLYINTISIHAIITWPHFQIRKAFKTELNVIELK